MTAKFISGIGPILTFIAPGPFRRKTLLRYVPEKILARHRIRAKINVMCACFMFFRRTCILVKMKMKIGNILVIFLSFIVTRCYGIHKSLAKLMFIENEVKHEIEVSNLSPISFFLSSFLSLRIVEMEYHRTGTRNKL